MSSCNIKGQCDVNNAVYFVISTFLFQYSFSTSPFASIRCNPEFGIEWKNPAYRGGTNKSVLFHSIENHIPYH